jgi:hypothetical protein
VDPVPDPLLLRKTLLHSLSVYIFSPIFVFSSHLLLGLPIERRKERDMKETKMSILARISWSGNSRYLARTSWSGNSRYLSLTMVITQFRWTKYVHLTEWTDLDVFEMHWVRFLAWKSAVLYEVFRYFRPFLKTVREFYLDCDTTTAFQILSTYLPFIRVFSSLTTAHSIHTESVNK